MRVVLIFTSLVKKVNKCFGQDGTCRVTLFHRSQMHSAELQSRARIKRKMLICSNQGGLIPGLLPHLVCNWPCGCNDDADGWVACWRLWCLSSGPSPISASSTSQHGCYSVVSASWATLPQLFLIADSLFVMNINIGRHLPDAWEWGRREEGGHDWNSSEPSGSNLDLGMEERGNGFRLLLFALALRFVWNEKFSPHGSLFLLLSPRISQYWPIAYRSSCLHDTSEGR